jgi:hypothetical protein
MRLSPYRPEAIPTVTADAAGACNATLTCLGRRSPGRHRTVTADRVDAAPRAKLALLAQAAIAQPGPLKVTESLLR